MTAPTFLAVALILLVAGIAGAVQSVRSGQWEQPRWRVVWMAWVSVASAVVLYGSVLVSNATPGG
jgi:divalent metal cation (Fe/Co/Zn/Cd) transporter